MDWKIGIRLADQQYVHLATLRDPYGATFIAVDVYPVSSSHAHVTETDIRTTLRQAFEEWGMPDEIQTDGEPGINSQSHDGFPSRFQLWLIGLGIRHRRIRPGVATDDAEVERGHRTIYDYAFVGNLDKPLDEMRSILNHAREELNFEYPSRAHGCQHCPPLQAHPEMLEPKRLFLAENEEEFFDLARVDAYLAGFRWERRVGKTGQITLGGAHEYYLVGRAYAQQIVRIQFDPKDRHYVAFNLKDEEIRRWPARKLSADEILNLSAEA